jgi:TPR repeat protein
MKLRIAALVALAALLTMPLLAQSSSMPDLTKLYHQRVNCHGAYDALVQTARDGGESTDEEFAFAETYEGNAVAGVPCPEVPDSLHERAINRTVSNGETISRLAKYIEQDDPLAYYEAGRAVLAGNVDGVGDDGAVEFISKAAELGDPESIFFLARLHLGGTFGVPSDFDSATPLIEQAANLGHIDAMNMIGLAYYEGSGGKKKDHRTAFQLFQKAAAEGHVYSAYMAAYMANEGEGTKEDHDLAYRLARNLAEQGEVVGAVLAASALLQQDDVRKHEDEVLYWMDAAMEYGDDRIRAEMAKYRPQVEDLYQRMNAPPEYRPREWKACPMKTVCLVNQFTGVQQCTTNKDYWSDCDG